MAYLRVSLPMSTVLMGLLLALLTITFDGLAVSFFCIVCWVIWACVGSLNFSRIRDEYVLAPSRQFYERQTQRLSNHQKLAVKFSPEALEPHPYDEQLLNGEESFNTDHTLRHLEFVLFNIAQAIYLNLRNRLFARLEDDVTGVLDRRLMATISSYHTILEYLLVLSHADDNQRKSFENRVETIIVHLQLIVSVIKQQRESESSDEPSVLLTYTLSEAFATVYTNLRGLMRNSSGRLLDQVVLFVIFPLGQWAQPSLDSLRLNAASESSKKDGDKIDVFDKHPINIVVDDRELTEYLKVLLNPSSQVVFDAFQEDLALAVSTGDADG